MDSIYYENKHIHFFDCDENGFLSLPTYLSWCSEISGEQLSKRGITREHMLEDRQVFLLLQVSYEEIKPAMYHADCRLNTWEIKIQGAKFLRGYELQDEKGNILCRSSSAWILVDPISRKILRPKEYKYDSLFNDRPYLPLTPIKPIQGEQVVEHTIRRSELDGNHHVNNRHYAKYLIDYAPEQFSQKRLRKADISYIKEATLGEKINIYSYVESDNSYIVYGLFDDGKRCFEARGTV